MPPPAGLDAGPDGKGVLRGLPRLRGAGLRAARDALARLQRMQGLQVLPHDEARLRRGRGAGPSVAGQASLNYFFIPLSRRSSSSVRIGRPR